MNRIAKILTMAGAVWVTALLAAGCTKEGRPATGWEADPDAVRIEASVGTVTKTNPLGNDDEQTKFNSGDKIAVAAVDNGAVKKTVKYQFDGSSWAPVADESGDYLLWDTPVTFRSWYPAAASWDEFTLPQDQSGASGSLADADFMTWSAGYKDDAAIPDGSKLSIVMQRQMALVTIVIDEVEDEYADLKNISVQVKRINSAHSSVNLQPDGTFKSDGDPTNVQPYKHVIESKSAYSAVVVPGNAVDKEVFLSIDVDGDKEGTQTKEIEEVTGIPAAEAGKHYTYKLIVGKQTVKIGGVTVENWTTGKLDGKFEAEVDDYSEWDGKKASSGYTFSGSGTSDTPYLIKSAADLAGLAANVNSGANYQGKYFKLEANIDLMGNEWTPIGNLSKYFYGTFDGNGKVITNLTISDATGDVGLFGAANGTIQNVVLRNASVASSSSNTVAALLVGYAGGGAIKSCKIDGVVSSDYVAAGIVGHSSKIEISDCEVNVECYGDGYTGGVFGSKDNNSGDVVVKNCIVRGRIFGKIVGGIAGMLHGSDVISGCKSYATLSQFDKKNYTTAGGIAGEAYYKCKFEDCEVYGNIDIECENNSEYFPLSVGGAIGLAREVTISNLKFEGTMNVTSIKKENKVGAVIGEVQNSLTVSSECTYRKSGTGTFPPVGTCPEGVDISKITGI